MAQTKRQSKVAPIVVVHGLWMGGWAMRPLAARLRAAGRQVKVFSYPTRSRGIADNAAALAALVRQFADHQIHIVAHSLGGLVTLRALSDLTDHQGKVVLLGSPIAGSATAQHFTSWPGAKLLLGEAASGLTQRPMAPPPGWEVSMIAGTRRLGLGVLVSPRGAAGDGTVGLEETRAAWLRQHIELPETHSSMLVSKRIAEQVLALL